MAERNRVNASVFIVCHTNACMKCLSLKQSFAELVVSGRKTIELRSWNTKFRGWFLVHASGNVDVEACKLLGLNRNALPRRAVVGKAYLYGVREYLTEREFTADQGKHMALGEYVKPRFGFLIRDATRTKPVPLLGRLGFFDVDPNICEADKG